MDEKKTVLIVEDEKSIVDILQYNLKKEYKILTANDGEAGLDMALKENPDILLLDLMLPKLDGFAVCRILREKGSRVPVIILTAREEEDDKVRGLELGADDYITKPFSMREVPGSRRTSAARLWSRTRRRRACWRRADCAYSRTATRCSSTTRPST